MANTQLSDAVIPEVYLDYVANDSPEKTAFIEGGIAVTNPVLGQQANSGGNVVEIPHWNDLATDYSSCYECAFATQFLVVKVILLPYALGWALIW